MKKYTIAKIAQLAKVSPATVSRVINGYPHIRPEVREHVQAIITETGFQPNNLARSLALERSNIIGLVIPKGTKSVFTDPYFPLLTNGISQVSNQQKLTLALFIFHSEQEGHETINSITATGLLDGLILTTDRVTLDRNTDPFIPKLIERHMPFVLIGRPESDYLIPYIDTDNHGGAKMAMYHLIEQGYRRIATIASRQNPAGDDRLLAYRQVLEAYEIPYDEALVTFGDYTAESGYAMMMHLLPQRPRAVFAASDTMALGALYALQQAGVRVPEEIAVIGFDDIPSAAQSHPPLTTIHQPIEKLGRISVEMLLKIIEDKHRTQRLDSHILPCHLVVRGSTVVQP